MVIKTQDIREWVLWHRPAEGRIVLNPEVNNEGCVQIDIAIELDTLYGRMEFPIETKIRMCRYQQNIAAEIIDDVWEFLQYVVDNLHTIEVFVEYEWSAGPFPPTYMSVLDIATGTVYRCPMSVDARYLYTYIEES